MSLLFVACAASSANAQWSSTEPHRNFEITPFGGSRFGGVINTSSGGSSVIDDLTIKSTWDYGIIGDIDLLPNSLPRPSGRVYVEPGAYHAGAHNSLTGLTSPLGKLELNNYQWGVDYNFGSRTSKLQPFVVGGMGFTHFSSGGELPFQNKLSFNLGRRREVFRRPSCGRALRRALGAFAHYLAGSTFFDPFFGFFQANVNNYAEQFQANLGLIFRF